MMEAYSAKDLGRAVRSLRKQRGWTQEELSEWCGVNRKTIMALERGGPVSIEIAMRALALLGAKVVLVQKGARMVEESSAT
jgi:transcriptional regulator with XRE-family HTH domain